MAKEERKAKETHIWRSNFAVAALTSFKAELLAVVVCALVRVEGEEIVPPELGHAEPAAATESEDAGLAVLRPIHVARVEERGDLVYLRLSCC